MLDSEREQVKTSKLGLSLIMLTKLSSSEGKVQLAAKPMKPVLLEEKKVVKAVV